MQPIQTPLPSSTEIGDWAYKLSTQLDAKRPSSVSAWLRWHRARKIAKKLNLSCNGQTTKDSLGAIRLFVAGGISYWISNSRHKTPEEMVLHILWPLIIAPKLPKDWFEHMQGISAPPLAAFVQIARAKVERHGELYYFLEAWTDLTPAIYQVGLPRLLDDMRDPKRGGAALDAIRICAGIPPPPLGSDKTSLNLALWIVGAGAAGVIGNRFDDATKDIWNPMFSAIYNLGRADAATIINTLDVSDELIEDIIEF